jgi:hypothetical protein
MRGEPVVRNDLARLERLRANRAAAREANRAAAEQKRVARIFQRVQGGKR